MFFVAAMFTNQGGYVRTYTEVLLLGFLITVGDRSDGGLGGFHTSSRYYLLLFRRFFRRGRVGRGEGE